MTLSQDVVDQIATLINSGALVPDELTIDILKNRISFLKDKANTTITALQTALYDEKAQDDRWIDDGQTSDIDSLDAFNYSFEYWFKQLMIGGNI